jgi:hypothetical protein
VGNGLTAERRGEPTVAGSGETGNRRSIRAAREFAMTFDNGTLFDALSSTIPSSILIVDENLIVLMANRNFLEKSRGTLGTVQGLNLQEVLPGGVQGHSARSTDT